jgi:hypothetical protein
VNGGRPDIASIVVHMRVTAPRLDKTPRAQWTPSPGLRCGIGIS